MFSKKQGSATVNLAQDSNEGKLVRLHPHGDMDYVIYTRDSSSISATDVNRLMVEEVRPSVPVQEKGRLHRFIDRLKS